MAGIRFVLLNILVTTIVAAIILAVGVWWLQMSFLPDVRNELTTATQVDQLAAADAPPHSRDVVPAMVAEVLPAVVSINITAEVPLYERYVEPYNPFGSWWGGFGIPQQRQIGTEERQISGGTGFFVSPDGYLVTNRHVVDRDNVSYSAITNDGTSYPVTVVARDPLYDIAVLKIDATTTFTHLPFAAADNIELGQTVVAIGNALAEFPNSVSVGVVSGVSRNIVAQSGYEQESLEGVIQTDAAINQGNSGGPLLNVDGEVIGVNVAVAGNSENIGFALPGSVVQRVVDDVRETGEIVRPYLGVRYVQIDAAVAARNDLPVESGVLVVRGNTPADLAVLPGSPADQAGIEANDIIVAVNDIELDGSKSLASVLRSFRPGDTVSLTLWRDGQTETVSVILAKAPDSAR